MPLFVWAIETYAILLVVVLPALSAGADDAAARSPRARTSSYRRRVEPAALPARFWFFGHPEVYIMVLPVFGMISEIIPVFSRKPIFGYKAVAFSTVGIAFFSLLVWAHHMFEVGPRPSASTRLHDRVDGDRRADGRKDLQLGRDDVARKPPASTRRCCSRSRSSRCSRWAASRGSSSRRSRSTGRSPTAITSSPIPLRALRRLDVRQSSAGLYYWWPKMFGRMLDERLGRCTSG